MVDKNIQDLINLYKSGELLITEKKIIKEIEKNPNSFFLYDFLGIVLSNQKNSTKLLLTLENL